MSKLHLFDPATASQHDKPYRTMLCGREGVALLQSVGDFLAQVSDNPALLTDTCKSCLKHVDLPVAADTAPTVEPMSPWGYPIASQHCYRCGIVDTTLLPDDIYCAACDEILSDSREALFGKSEDTLPVVEPTVPQQSTSTPHEVAYDVYLYKWRLFATRVDQGLLDALKVEFPNLIALRHVSEEYVWQS